MFPILLNIPTVLTWLCFLRYVHLESSSVPVLLWSNQANLFDAQDRFKSLVDPIESNNLEGYLSQNGHNAHVIAFVQDDLNVEQFAANDASFVSTIFENPQYNPLFFTNVKNAHNIYSNFKTDLKFENSIQNSVVYMGGKKLQENDALIKSYVVQANQTGPNIFMLTGKNNEYLNKNTRSRRDVSKDSTEILVINNTAGEPCLFFYSEKMSVTFYKGKESNSLTFTGVPEITGTCYPKNDKSKVLNAAIFNLTYTNSSDILKISFNFSQNSNSYWEVKPFIIEHNGQYKSFISENLNLLTENYFSYSCQKSVFSVKSQAKSDYTSADVVFQRFQIQPFAVINSKYKFESSFDCSVWFTLPIFASLFVCLLLVLILYFGVRALLSISTPDRFENPKGRTLIITNFEE